jgi:hypothetical protein
LEENTRSVERPTVPRSRISRKHKNEKSGYFCSELWPHVGLVSRKGSGRKDDSDTGTGCGSRNPRDMRSKRGHAALEAQSRRARVER